MPRLVIAVALLSALGAGAGIVLHPAEAVHAAGLTYCVGPGSGDPASGCANPNHQDFGDIGQALALAADGDTINVAGGTYPAITIASSVTITGGYPGGPGGYCCSPSPTGSTISGNGGPAITVISGSPTVVYINESDGVVVTGGTGSLSIPTGATMSMDGGGTLVQRQNTIDNAGMVIVTNNLYQSRWGSWSRRSRRERVKRSP